MAPEQQTLAQAVGLEIEHEGARLPALGIAKHGAMLLPPAIIRRKSEAPGALFDLGHRDLELAHAEIPEKCRQIGRFSLALSLDPGPLVVNRAPG